MYRIQKTKRYEYDKDYTVQLISYLDESGLPLTSSRQLRYVKLRKTYDETGKRLQKDEYLDAQGAPTRNRAAVYGKAYEYDPLGRLIREYTFDAEGRISSGMASYAITQYTYDSSGARTATRYSASGNKVG